MRVDSLGLHFTQEDWAELELLRAENKRLLDEIDRLNAERRWIPVSERLPEDNIEVLIFDGTDVFLACHQSRVPQWSGDGAYYHGGWYDMITHWQPLPPAPESEGE